MAKAFLTGVCGAALLAVMTPAAAQEVTFQDVIRNPSDPQLNITYAQQRMEAGDFLSAAATLERLLLNDPNWDQARLLYASVLYQLGDYPAAKREAELLEGRDLTAEAEAEIARYKEKADQRAADVRLSGSVSAGVAYDSNAGSVLDDDGILLPDVDQYSFVARGNARLEKSISQSSERTIFGDAYFFYQNFEDGRISDLLIAQGRGGFAGENRLVDWRIGAALRTVRIADEEYLREAGITSRFTRDITQRMTLSLNASWFDQDYQETENEGPIGDLRSGDRYDVTLGLRRAFSSTFSANIAATYRDKQIDSDAVEATLFGYEFTGGAVGFQWFLPEGFRLGSDLIVREYEYEAGREDDFLFARLSVGVPISAIARWTDADLAPWELEFAADYTERDASQDVFDFDNSGAELRLRYRF